MEKAVDCPFGASQLRYTRVIFGARLCEGYLRLGDLVRARALLEEFLTICREGGYRHGEGLVERISARSSRATIPRRRPPISSPPSASSRRSGRGTNSVVLSSHRLACDNEPRIPRARVTCSSARSPSSRNVAPSTSRLECAPYWLRRARNRCSHAADRPRHPWLQKATAERGRSGSAAPTTSAPAQRTISAGRRWIIRFQIVRASSYPASPDVSRGPEKLVASSRRSRSPSSRWGPLEGRDVTHGRRSVWVVAYHPSRARTAVARPPSHRHRLRGGVPGLRCGQRDHRSAPQRRLRRLGLKCWCWDVRTNGASRPKSASQVLDVGRRLLSGEGQREFSDPGAPVVGGPCEALLGCPGDREGVDKSVVEYQSPSP